MSKSFTEQSQHPFNDIPMNEAWRPHNRRFIHYPTLVDAAKLISKFTIGQKKTQSFVLVSIAVIVESLFNFHDILLHLGAKARWELPFLLVAGRYAGL